MSTKTQDSDAPWRDEERLRELYWDEGLSPREMEDVLGCTERTIWEWIGRHGMETRRPGQQRYEWVSYDTSPNGYERWKATCPPDRDTVVMVHRLLAVAEHGFNALDGNHVHHKNGVKWDNRPENIEVLSPSEHMRQHHRESFQRDGESNPHAKLTWEDVREMRARRESATAAELAEEFGTSEGNVYNIWNRNSWVRDESSSNDSFSGGDE